MKNRGKSIIQLAFFFTIGLPVASLYTQEVWEPTIFPYSSYAVHLLVTKNESLLTAVEDIGILRSTNFGSTWTKTTEPYSWIYALTQSSSGSIFAGTDVSIQIQKSTNDGETWYNSGLETGPKLALAASSDAIFAYVENEGIFKSTDDGQTWTYSNLWLKGGANMFWEKTHNTIYVASSDSLRRSTDDGQTWQAVEFPRHRIMSFASTDNGDVYVGTNTFGQPGGLYRSRDNGDHWERLGMIPDQGSTNLNAIAINSLGHIFAAGDGITSSIDSGATGFDFTYNLRSYPIFCLAMGLDDRLYAGATAAVWRTKQSTTHIQQVDSRAPSALTLEPVFPNPVTGETHFRFSLPGAETVSVTLRDALGRKTNAVLEQSLPAGTHQASLDLRGIEPGPYFLLLVAGNAVRERMVLVAR